MQSVVSYFCCIFLMLAYFLRYFVILYKLYQYTLNKESTKECSTKSV